MSSTFAVRTLAPLATHVSRSTRLVTASSALDRWVAGLVLVCGLAAPATLVAAPHAAIVERTALSLTAYIGLVVVVLTWIGTIGRTRAVRGWIALGVAEWVALQAVLNVDHSANSWIAQVVMLAGIALAAAGAYQADLAGRASWREQIAVYLDAAVVTATASAVLIVLFMDRALVDPRAAAALLFAVVFVAIMSATVILDLAVLAEPAPRGAYAILAGLALLGVGFVLRAGAAVDAPLGHDAWLVSAGVLTIAYGSATWNDLVETGRRYVHVCAVLRNVLPISAAGVAVTLLLIASPAVEGLARLLLIGLVALALIGVVIRQTLLLAERDGMMRHLSAARSAAERRTQQIAGMEAVGRLLAVAGPTSEAMDAVVELVREHFGYQRICVFLADGQQIRLSAQRGYPRLLETLDPSTGIAGRVARTRRGELVQDVLSDPDYLMADPGVRSEICAPMLSEDEFLGVVVVEANADEPLDETDFAAVLAVADQLAASIALGVRRQRLIRERNFTSAVLDTVGAVVVVTDADGHVVRFNPACAEVTGYSLDELALPDAFARLVPDEQRPVVEAVVGEVLAVGAPRSLENEWIRKDGSRRTITWWNRPVLNDDGTVDYVIATGIDVTERKLLEVQLAHRALHDPLTALPNRALFMDRLEHSLRRRDPPTSVAALFIDLDDFKVINDTLGHEAGDRVLIEVARRLMAAIRPGDTAARVGGDEFAVVLEDLPRAEEATAVAQRVLDALCGPEVDLGDRTITIEASIGVATAAASGDMNADRLLRNADIAMYAAKSVGGARSEVFHPRMYSATTQRRALHAQLTAAIENDEFVVHYQPIVRLRGGRLTGMEALVRWNHPRDGLLRPQHFIEVAEQSGLIVPIGARVIVDACRKMAQWLADDERWAPEWVSVNVSPRQFDDPKMFDTVRDALLDAGIEPSRLVIEITESLVVSGSDTTTDTITRLTELGVRFAVDDFGTGYSSLSYLRRFPIEFLKIDRSFITGVDTDSKQQAFVGALVVMGRTLGLRVLSEGIETDSQYRAIRRLGCEFGQGYFFGEPAEASDLQQPRRRDQVAA